MCPENVEPKDCQLLAQAMEARTNAYCPYSNFAVGAAVRRIDGRMYAAANVENSSYGLTVCAERNAIAAAVADGMRPGELEAVAVIADTQQPIVPCGACLQVIAEFAADNCLIISETMQEKEVGAWNLDELLPERFSL
ncbi:cytidine deaminase [bacterium]|nr:cytidine deaminase [bacterium]